MVLNAKELINKKNIIEDKKNKTIEIEVPDLGAFKFRLPNINDYNDSEAYGKSRKDNVKANDYLLYTCCLEPDLKDPELQKAYGTKDPVDIVDKIFLFGEINTLSDILIKKAGFDKEVMNVYEKLKN